MPQSANLIQLVLKATQLVDKASVLGPSTPADLAKAIDEPRPSVYRIIGSLEESGILRRAPGGLVELGTGILRLADAATDALLDHEALITLLEGIQSSLGLTAAFWIPRNGTAVCLEQVDSTEVDLHELSSGRILPLHTSAASHVLLAWQSPEILEEVLAQAPYKKLASRTPVDAETLRQLVADTKREGWRMESNEIVDGIAAVGFPVFNADGSIFGALTAAGLVDHVVKLQEEAKTVLAAAAQTLTDLMKDFRVVPSANEQSDAPESKESVLTKASSLMDALARERVATSARLASLTGEHISSVYRMLGTLVEAGWIEQIGHRGSYRVGSKMISLAGSLLSQLDLRRAAIPVLREIHNETGETVLLCIRSGTRAVCIERIDGRRVNSRRLALGSSLPLHIGAAPRALLAFDTPPSWEEYAALLSQSAEFSLGARSRTEFYGKLKEIRDAGFALSDDEVTTGMAAVGAPIFDHRGHVIASLSVSGLRDAILHQPESSPGIIELACDGARQLSRYFGAPDDCIQSVNLTR
ncbi:IclR family transcriptional regulator C-terminal domain-containing protein [Arthrobacter sp. NicSoilC5]|uniref:IclR family transcriptional regulator n=1 Tax=Arthrobacter sp. NicSoilC5 TaxID=2831000 RepID=UPI001CC5BB20|nr:IclR family transcriptional regulator C-terminal domain-containing protein [Arthrobacter sp. NicSoilC5]BCW78396.1 IcIR family transcriptional regulator [Arthrobacter sp. NicSoilC5]